MRWWVALCVLSLLGCGGGDDPWQPPPLPEAWAVMEGGQGTDACVAVAAHADHSVVAAGNFDAPITLGRAEPGETTLDVLGSTDAYVVRLSRAGTLSWVRHLGGVATVAAQDLERFDDGSVVVVGEFEELATFGIGELDALSLSSVGAADVFLARFAPDGTLSWVARAGGAAWDEPRGVDTFPDGSCVVTGYYLSPTMTFGAGEAHETVLTSGGATECFVARYAVDGTLMWAKRAGGDATCTGNDIAAFAGGSSVVAMRIEGTMTIGPGEANEAQFTSLGERDFLVARYDADGHLAWARQGGGAARDVPWGVAVFGDESFAITGLIAGEATFGKGDPQETTLSNVEFWDMVVVRYNADGTVAWARRIGGAGRDGGRSVATFRDGSCVVAGRTVGDFVVAAGEPNETPLVGYGEADVFLARYRANGTLDWATNMGGALADSGQSVSPLSDGTFALGGTFHDGIVIPAGEWDDIPLLGDGSQDAFVAYSGVGGW